MNEPETPLGVKEAGLLAAQQCGIAIPSTIVMTRKDISTTMAFTEISARLPAGEWIIRPSVVAKWIDAWKFSGQYPSRRFADSSSLERALSAIRMDVSHHETLALTPETRDDLLTFVIQPFLSAQVSGISHLIGGHMSTAWRRGSLEPIAEGVETGHLLEASLEEPTVVTGSVMQECDLAAVAPHLAEAFVALRRLAALSMSLEAEWLVAESGFVLVQLQPTWKLEVTR